MRRIVMWGLLALVFSACADVAPAPDVEIATEPSFALAGTQPDVTVFTKDGFGCSWVGSDYYMCVEFPEGDVGDTSPVNVAYYRNGAFTVVGEVEGMVLENGYEALAGSMAAEGDVIAWVLGTDPSTVFVNDQGYVSNFRAAAPVYSLRVHNRELMVRPDVSYTLTGRPLLSKGN